MIEIVYIGVGIKETLGEFDNLPEGNITEWVKNIIAEHGYNPETEFGILYANTGNEMKIYRPEMILSENDISLVYVNIPEPNNAFTFFRENGITYFFHTSETPHRKNPHCHARFGDSEICISLNTLEVIGGDHIFKKKREALCFVKQHQVELLAEWNRIIELQ